MSVKQGCPLSPLLFALYLELDSLSISVNSNIRGFNLGDSDIKLLAYADDVAISYNDKRSVFEAVSITRQFCGATGAAVNWNKCYGFWQGAWATKPAEYQGNKLSETPRKYLGVANSCQH